MKMTGAISLISLYGAANGDALIIEHDETRGIVVSAQAGGAEVELAIAPATWFAIARQIYESRSTLSLFQLADDR